MEKIPASHITLPGPLVRYPRAAEIVDCSQRKLWKLVKDKKIPVVRIGGSVRFDLNDLAAFIDASKTATPDPVAAADIAEFVRGNSTESNS